MNNNTMKKVIIIFTIFTIAVIIIICFLLLMYNNKKKAEEISYIEKHTVDANNKKRPEKKESELVEENEYNTFSIQAVTEESLLSKYLEDYKYNAINHIEDSYNSLDKEYREKRFGSIDEYEKYLGSRKDIIKTMEFSKYQINKYDKYEQYICLDQYENYYIFNKLPNMSYTVILDTYTVNLPQFTEEYAKASDQGKAGLNIEKFISAINQEDYNFAYSILDDSFKANNMPQTSDFKNYVNNNFYSKNKFEHISANKDGENIIYKSRILNKNMDNKESKYITFVVKLLEGTDFVMAFSFE